jgi:hypothetical protein
MFEHNRRRIITHFVHPPIPFRGFDWCAYFADDGEEAGRYGWGATAEAAEKDLRQRFGDGEFGA